jgi:hypothetical protein
MQLERSFRRYRSVDTDSIDPKDLDIFVISKATQRITEISS